LTRFFNYFTYFYILFLSAFIYYIYRGGLNKKYIIPNANKRSDTVFILGSGSSLNSVNDLLLKKINNHHDVFAFNASIGFDKLNIDYAIVREEFFLFRNLFGLSFPILSNKKYFQKFQDNFFKSHLMNTKIFLAVDRKAGSNILWYKFCKTLEHRIFFYNNLIDRKIDWPPSCSLKGIPHGNSTLLDAINISFILNYKRIILLGVDLYDSRYFYLQEGDTRSIDVSRGKSYKDPHDTNKRVMGSIIKWDKFLRERGVDLFVYNPKSLLAKHLRVFDDKFLS
jgi:hypothetical protein